MPQLSTSISDELNERFRSEVSRRFGAYKRGSIQKAIIEALENWIVYETSNTLDGEKNR